MFKCTSSFGLSASMSMSSSLLTGNESSLLSTSNHSPLQLITNHTKRPHLGNTVIPTIRHQTIKSHRQICPTFGLNRPGSNPISHVLSTSPLVVCGVKFLIAAAATDRHSSDSTNDRTATSVSHGTGDPTPCYCSGTQHSHSRSMIPTWTSTYP
jgi:hypothetical protein